MRTPGGPRSVVAGTHADATKRVPPTLMPLEGHAPSWPGPARTRQSASLQRGRPWRATLRRGRGQCGRDKASPSNAHAPGGPRSVVAGICADATERVPPTLGRESSGGPRSVVAGANADATKRVPPTLMPLEGHAPSWPGPADATERVPPTRDGDPPSLPVVPSSIIPKKLPVS